MPSLNLVWSHFRSKPAGFGGLSISSPQHFAPRPLRLAGLHPNRAGGGAKDFKGNELASVIGHGIGLIVLWKEDILQLELQNTTGTASFYMFVLRWFEGSSKSRACRNMKSRNQPSKAVGDIKNMFSDSMEIHVWSAIHEHIHLVMNVNASRSVHKCTRNTLLCGLFHLEVWLSSHSLCSAMQIL